MKRAALYVRVSTQEQKIHGISVDNQITALTEYAQEHEYQIAGVYNDAGISARKKYTSRPALLQLMEDCRKGLIDIVLFTKLDRWFRSVADYYQVQTVLEECHIPWRAIWEDYETETSSGILKVNIMLSVAQAEADRTSDRIKSAMEYKRARGDYLGKAPTGYKIENNVLVKDPAKSEAIDALFQTYLKTLNAEEAMLAAHELGLKGSKTWFYSVLKNPVYAGLGAGNHKTEGYITEEQHNLILTRTRANYRRTKEPNNVYLFSGLLYCAECGLRLAASSKTIRIKTGEHRYAHYVCNSGNKVVKDHPYVFISEMKLERVLLTELQPQLDARIYEVELLNSAISQGKEQKKKEALEAKLKRILVLFEDGDITIDEYRQKRDALKYEISQIQITTIPIPERLPDDWLEVYHSLDDDHKRVFWRKIVKRIIINRLDRDHPIIEFL